jgi:hypothetical protein
MKWISQKCQQALPSLNNRQNQPENKMQITELLNLERYPLDCLGSEAGQLLINNIKANLNEDGSCALEHFITDQALTTMAQQAILLEEMAFAGPTEVTPYFFNYKLGQGLDVSDNHPIKRKGKRNLKQVATDLIPAEHLLSQLFDSSLMTHFLSQVFEVPIYQYRDRYQSLNISVMQQGGCQQWHFDSGHMVTTLLLQEPDSGGVFEYVPKIRSESNENFEEVKRVLDGNSDRVKQLKLKAGMLSIFQGHYSLHRVTEVQGPQKRIQAILGYTSDPGLKGSVDSSILHYGPRVAELESIKNLV